MEPGGYIQYVFFFFFFFFFFDFDGDYYAENGTGIGPGWAWDLGYLHSISPYVPSAQYVLRTYGM